MRSLALGILAAAGCTTVVQEPADLAPARVEALVLADEGGSAVRVTSAPNWGEPGEAFHVTNRLTGAFTSATLGGTGALDLTIAGRLDDVFAISNLPDGSPHAPQITTRDGATLHAWGWGFGGVDGCDPGVFDAGTLEHGGPHEHEVCFARAAPAPLYPDHEVPAIGTSHVRLELGEEPVLRFRASADVAGDVVVRLATADGTYEAGHRVESALWQTRSLLASEFHHGDTVLAAGVVVTAVWIAADGPAPAGGLAVDDVVFESVTEAGD